MSHTPKGIAGGPVLLAVLALAARWFIPLWLIGAAVNLGYGVARAGYSVAEEAPILLVLFLVPAAVALLVAWMLSRPGGACPWAGVSGGAAGGE